MSQAYKCDRCGAFFEREDMWNKLLVRRENQLPICVKDYDLCDSCQAMLELFLKGNTVKIDLKTSQDNEKTTEEENKNVPELELVMQKPRRFA